jgi:hypothetical protein
LYVAITNDVSGIPMVRVVSSRDGTSWATLPTPSDTNLASDRSSLAIDSLGRLHLVWTELSVEGGQIFHASFVAGAWSTPEQLSHSPGYAGFPSLAVDARDRVHVSWYGFDGAFYQVYYRKLDAGGWTDERALTNEAVDATNPALALGPGGEVHIAWFRENRQGTGTEISYLRLEEGSIRETRTVSAIGVDAANPSLAVDLGGTVHVAWSALVGSARIQYAEEITAGSWSPIEFVSPPEVGGLHPSVALSRSDGGVRIVWEGTDGEIYAQDRRMNTWSSPLVLSTGGVNRYPNARWAQNHNPFCSEGGPLDVVWTREDAGTPRLEYAALDAQGRCDTARSTGDSGLVLQAGISVVAAIATASVLMYRRQERYPRPPQSEEK